MAGIGKPNLRGAFGKLFTDIRDLSEPAVPPEGAYREAERGLIWRIKDAINNSPKSPEGYVRLSVVRDRLDDFDARAFCYGDLVSFVRECAEFDVKDGRSIESIKSTGDYVRMGPSSEVGASDRLSKSVAGNAQAFMGRKRPVAASFMQSAWLLFPLRAIAVSHHQRIQHVF